MDIVARAASGGAAHGTSAGTQSGKPGEHTGAGTVGSTTLAGTHPKCRYAFDAWDAGWEKPYSAQFSSSSTACGGRVRVQRACRADTASTELGNGDSYPDLQCIRLKDDFRPALCSHPHASEMRRRLPAGPRPRAGAGGRSPVRRLAWRADPLERQQLSWKRQTGLAWKRGLPSAHVRGSEPGCGEVLLRYPARHGVKAYPSVGRPSERPSRAFLVPRAIRSEATGREPGRPAPPPETHQRTVAARGAQCPLGCIYSIRLHRDYPCSLFPPRQPGLCCCPVATACSATGPQMPDISYG
jgi:hypothetical protein